MNSKKNLIIVVVLSLLSVSAFAQAVSPDDTNKDENGKIRRGAYLTNPWYDNWSIGFAAGAQSLVSGTKDYNKGVDLSTARISPAFEVYLTKWFAPSFGVRFAVQGLDLSENWPNTRNNVIYHYPPLNIDSVNYFGFTYMHGSALWNIVNTFWGYKYNRFFTVAPYVHAGYLRLTMPKTNPVSGDPTQNTDGLFTKVYRDREIGMGFGILGTMRLDDHINMTIDLRDINIAGRYHDANNGGRVNIPTVFLGVQYNIHKSFWNRSFGLERDRDAAIAATAASAAALAQAEAARKALEDQNAALAAQNDDLANKNKSLADENAVLAENARNVPYDELREVAKEELKNSPDDEFLQRAAKADQVLYFPINVDKLPPTELLRLTNYVKFIEENEPDHVYYITGSADKGTGTYAINTRLSKGRAENVRKLLIREFGVPASRVVVKGNIITDKHADGRLDRCVLMENE